MIDLLERLMLIPAPSGYEFEMSAFMKDAFSQHASEVEVDRLGNVIARFPGLSCLSPPATPTPRRKPVIRATSPRFCHG